MSDDNESTVVVLRAWFLLQANKVVVTVMVGGAADFFVV